MEIASILLHSHIIIATFSQEYVHLMSKLLCAVLCVLAQKYKWNWKFLKHNLEEIDLCMRIR